MTEIHGTIILLVIICDCETQSLALWKQIKDASEHSTEKNIYNYEIQRKLDNDYLHSPYSLTSTVKRNDMGCAVNMEDMTYAYKILIKKPEAEEKRD
jgi:hypothetical protein